ncbi:MAG TPA: N-acetylmuramoyl-L-alanine amidase-like domain-containing protein, partial [Longimicrobiaceae bacterium]|nr:N-acetylmuramoyl-L-alanine amidase-like domain-containing protein [Longimicrobiaceae bacterium]
MNRRDFVRMAGLAAAAAALPGTAWAVGGSEDDAARLRRWVRTLRTEGLAHPGRPLGPAVARVGELAVGAPYAAGTLDAYVSAPGGDPAHEPLTLMLSRFDCVSLVESCLAVARLAASGAEPTWSAFGRQIETMRYRGGARDGYLSRLHYFSEWIADNTRRGIVRDLGGALGAGSDARPLRFMTEHRASYPALRGDAVFRGIAVREQALDATPRHLVPTAHIAAVQGRIQTGDVLAFATSIPGLDATHTGLAYRMRGGALHVLHAPLSGGQVQISHRPLPEYVAGLGRSTGILVARP